MEKVENIKSLIEGKDILQSLQILSEKFEGEIVFSTSFGIEDQVITDFIFKNNLPIKVFTLDTGRNFQETYSTWNKTLLKYKKSIDVFYPNTEGVEKLVREKGPSSFYDSVENRKECCYIRKVEPLNRALKNQKIWITGIRAEQSTNRHDMSNVEWDGGHNLIKFHPLFDWSFDDVKHYVRDNGIPYNPLHDKGFVSIGCAPCTRAIQAGEDFRAGRWWWEDASKKECGLHIHQEAKTSA
jgi:phosphoadenosine phosphosulfate reductase